MQSSKGLDTAESRGSDQSGIDVIIGGSHRRLVSLIGHDITIVTPEKDTVTIPPSGVKSILKEIERQAGHISIGDSQIPVDKIEFGEVEGIPEPEDGVVYLAGSQSRAALQERVGEVLGTDRTHVHYDKHGKVKGIGGLALDFNTSTIDQGENSPELSENTPMVIAEIGNEEVELVSLRPETVIIQIDEKEIVIPPSKIVATEQLKPKQSGSISISNQNVPLSTITCTGVAGMPKPSSHEGRRRIYVVGTRLLKYIDVIALHQGEKSAIRDESGVIKAVQRLVIPNDVEITEKGLQLQNSG